MVGEFDFDLVAIGAGTAGFVAPVTAHGLGKKVAMVEKRKLGEIVIPHLYTKQGPGAGRPCERDYPGGPGSTGLGSWKLRHWAAMGSCPG